ncbi:MAG TPA: PilX N-terminal domain-containing pilus assembly protein [Pyrinomonadaceae bacterium]|jgi:hypothetical protein
MFFNRHTHKKQSERGAALAMAIIVVAILAVVALTALTFSSTEARIAGSDLQRTQTFYATEAAMEKMTNDFSNLFRRKMSPTRADLDLIEQTPPPALAVEGFQFDQKLEEDTDRLDELRAIQGLPNTVYPRVNISDGPYAGLYSSVIPYKMTSIGMRPATRTEVKLEREFNNYLVPLFQFGMFSNEDIEIHPGPLMTFNGRIHTNGNLYALRNTKFLNRITMAGEFVRDATRGGETNDAAGNQNVWIEVNGINVQSEIGSGSVKSGGGAVGGPNFPASSAGQRGYFPGSPNGVANPTWESESVKPPSNGTPNRFGGQVLTNTTGATALKLPLELAGNSAAELIKRALPTDGEILSYSRYHNKSQIRILLDGENDGSGATNVAGIPAGEGVQLKDFTPSVLNGGINVLKNISDAGAISGSAILQKKPTGGTQNAMTVRGVKSAPETVGGNYIPQGSGIRGRILIEIVKPDGSIVDVTQAILSMGMTEGEPNGIVYLQRPLWAGFVQGSRDRTGGNFDLVSITRNSQIGSGGCMTVADGEINDPTALYAANRGFIDTDLTAADEDGGTCTREAAPIGLYNMIVPINVYNVREGWVRSTLNEYDIYERGMTSVVEINMRNLARWLDGVYDANLLSGTEAVSANVKGDEGYVVYVSDRRGDQKNAEYLSDGTSYASTNGIVDNEDIYGPNGRLDEGEDVIDFGWTSSGASKKGTLQKDTRELPDSGTICCTPTNGAPVTDATRLSRAYAAMRWFNSSNYFRRAVRLFDGETLSTTGVAGKLSPAKGITISSENMVYVWGNFNTTGITGIPAGGSTLNDGGFTGPQVPSSIVCDAFFPLSKTWFDGLSALYPEGSSDARNLTGEAYRMADDALPSTSQGTSVRAGVIAGTTISSLTAMPGRDAAGLRRNGGIINYPRFLETWNLNGILNAWSYTGSFIPLFRSTQALAQWENDTAVIYMPPRRNWSFDQTFLTPNKLPPGTPFFQYIQATGFRQNLR